MKILFISNLKPPINGNSVVSENIIKYLSKKHKIKIIDSKLSVNSVDINKFSFIKVKRFFNLLKKIILITNKNKYDTVYLSSNLNFVGYLKITLIYLITFGKTASFIIHPHLYFNIGFLLKIFLNIKNVKLLSLDKNLIFNDKLIYFPNTNFDEKKIKIKHRKIKKLKILFISNLYKFKGVLDLISIVKKLKNKINFELDIIGGDGDITKNELLNIIKLNKLENNVFFHGPIFDRNLKSNFFDNSNLIIYPTKKDYLPLFLIEGISYGIPIISNDIGSINQIVINNFNGYLARNKDEYYSLINKLFISKSLHNKFSNNSIFHYKKNFSNYLFNKRIDHIFTLNH